MEAKVKELVGKLRVLEFAVKRSQEIIETNSSDAISRHESAIVTKIQACHTLKNTIEEERIEKEESEEEVTNWASSIEEKLKAADQTVQELRRAKDEIEKESRAFEKAEQEKHEQKLRQEQELFEQQLKFQKALEASKQSQAKAATKLPKLAITKFDGKYENWLPFWNKFIAEIDSADLSPVTKFVYLKELVEPKIRSDIDGLPLTTEGYARAKGILEGEYGKVSEIVNAYVQNILQLPVVKDSNPNEVDKFYKTLLYNVQSLETLGKLERVNGMARSVLDKLPGIKSDIVRGQEGWQDWGLAQLVKALRIWREINPCAEESGKEKRRKDKIFNTGAKKHVCVYCDDANHKSHECTSVVDVNERKKILATKRLCFNCTGAKHRASECKSNSGCQRCNQRHHTSICTSKEKLLAAEQGSKSVVYPIVSVEGVECRALLDTGAGSSYASAALLERLPKRSQTKEVRKIEMMLGSTTREVTLSTIDVASTDGKEKLQVEVTKVERGKLFTVDNPHYTELIQSFKHLEGITMIDNDPKPFLPVHLILGACDYAAIKTTEPPRIGQPGEPVAEKTKFGWTIMSPGKELDHSKMLLTQTSHTDYEDLCRLDVLGLEDRPEYDQREVYAEFREQLVRSDEGWYETGLPWKGAHPPLPNNRNGSLRRLANLQRKLRQTEMTESYSAIIEKQRADGIVETADHQADGVEFYIPHKAVVRDTAESTKVRIVYDASARAHPNAPSLNECLNAGPSLQNRLWSVLVRMRFHPIALTGDLKQACLQVRIKEAERDALRFHWAPDKQSTVETLRFTRALFGLAPSPFLLGGVIEQHLESWENRAPDVVAEIRKSMYVDGLISGKTTVPKAEQLKSSATEIFKDACFTLHKWHSNAVELEEPSANMKGEKSFAKQQLGTPDGGDSSILGLSWNKRDDEISVVVPKEKATATKRGILRKLAKTYDPLGFASPQTLQGKFIYREVCERKIAWDVPVPMELMTKWSRWEQLLPSKISTARTLAKHQEDIESIELHTFGDASIKGVSSVVYAVVRQASGVTQGLVAAKSRLAKQGLTKPRLELVSAHMAANLVSNVHEALDGFPVMSSHGWLDSTVALHWIRGAGDYKQFVANRVRKIQSHPQIQWRHIPTQENPADLGSRGGEVKNNKLWWDGPEWLSDKKQWPPDITTRATKESAAEAKVIRDVFAAVVEVADDSFDDLLTKFNLSKTMRVCAWVSRFLFNVQNPDQRVKGPLTTAKLDKQRIFWIKRAQTNCDIEEDRMHLNLQINAEGLLECRGRIQGQYPLYLPDTHPFTAKIVEDAHLRTLHGGVGMTMAHIRWWCGSLYKKQYSIC